MKVIEIFMQVILKFVPVETVLRLYFGERRRLKTKIA